MLLLSDRSDNNGRDRVKILKESKIIVAEEEAKEIAYEGFNISVIPFYKWASQIEKDLVL